VIHAAVTCGVRELAPAPSSPGLAPAGLAPGSRLQHARASPGGKQRRRAAAPHKQLSIRSHSTRSSERAFRMWSAGACSRSASPGLAPAALLLARGCSTPGQARTANSGGEPPHSINGSPFARTPQDHPNAPSACGVRELAPAPLRRGLPRRPCFWLAAAARPGKPGRQTAAARRRTPQTALHSHERCGLSEFPSQCLLPPAHRGYTPPKSCPTGPTVRPTALRNEEPIS